jgi:S1-C subfamily serine protease
MFVGCASNTPPLSSSLVFCVKQAALRASIVAMSMLVLPIASGQVSLTTAQIAKRVAPSVVVIQGKTNSGEVVGSGFIIARDGKVVTNLHVIRDLKTASAQLANGEIFDSISVLAIDERRDLAILQVAGVNLPALDLGNSDSLMVGEPVVAVGSPRGLEGTVTAGILSSVRKGDGFTLLQTDAAVNPGNSGGPLVNRKGQAIGVISFKLSSAEGLNFAIPISYVRGLLNNLHEPMSLERLQSSLNATAYQQSSGASLKETLDWLKEKLPLAANHYVLQNLDMTDFTYQYGHTVEHTIRTLPIRFDSCTIIFERTIDRVWEKMPNTRDTDTTRYTVPLGDLSGVEVSNDVKEIKNNYENCLAQSRTSHCTALIGLTFWWVSLNTKSDVILEETHGYWGNTSRPTTNATKHSADIHFFDESLAKRVSDAFKHAADLCRGTEPF